MNKLSKREKGMLYLLAIVAIIAAAVLLVIQPQMDRGDQLDADIASRQTELTDMQNVVLQAQGLEDKIAETQKAIEEAEEAFLPKMSNDDLDKYITGLIQSKGLTAAELTMTESEEQSLSEAVSVMKVDVVARGYASQFNALIDTVAQTKGIRLSACKLTLEQTQAPEPTPSPKPTKTPRTNKTATPSPLPSPTATPQPATYAMQLTFMVMECDPSLVKDMTHFGE